MRCCRHARHDVHHTLSNGPVLRPALVAPLSQSVRMHTLLCFASMSEGVPVELRGAAAVLPLLLPRSRMYIYIYSERVCGGGGGRGKGRRRKEEQEEESLFRADAVN